jgi:DNA repair exonuclease SbcCD nuclease subunit
LHLERVPSGLREIPDHLRGGLLECTYAAARRVFETALTESVRAVLLAGDVVDLSLSGPRAAVFLREQFELLAAEGIEVYWAGGRADPPHSWPRVSPLPANVHVFPVDHVQHFDLHHRGETIARITGISSAGDAQPSLMRFVPHPEGRFTIGVAYGQFSQANLVDQQVSYMALGGRHERKTFAAGDRKRLMHFPGTTQGVSPDEQGPHGCTLLVLEGDGTVRTQPITTNVFRWEGICVEADDSLELAELESRLAAAAASFRVCTDAEGLLVNVQVVGTGPAVDALQSESTRRAVVDRLRTLYGYDAPYIWTAKLDVRRKGGIAAALYEEDTILGDVLRELRRLEGEPADALSLESHVGDSPLRTDVVKRLTRLTPDQHGKILAETSEKCVALLSGRDSEPARGHSISKAG